MPHKIIVATLLWDANKHSLPFSQMYSEAWVGRLYRGVERNLTLPFEFIVFTDREREFSVPVTQIPLSSDKPNYGHCIEPYKLGQPMILMGLDTVITGNIDHLADYCLTADRLAMPLDPYNSEQVCNGVGLVPAGYANIGFDWRGENDMEWIRRFNPAVIDDVFPGHVVSFKGYVRKHGLGDARIVYFHGDDKPHQLNEPWIRKHWNSEDTMEDERRNNSKEFLESQGEIVKGASGWKAREARGIKRNKAKASEARQNIRNARAKVKAEREAAIAAEAAGKAKLAGERKPTVAELGALEASDAAALAELGGPTIRGVLSFLTEAELITLIESAMPEAKGFDSREQAEAELLGALYDRYRAENAPAPDANPDDNAENGASEPAESDSEGEGGGGGAEPFPTPEELAALDDDALRERAADLLKANVPHNIGREKLLTRLEEMRAKLQAAASGKSDA